MGATLDLMVHLPKKKKCVDSSPTFIQGKHQKNQNGKGRGSAYFENEGSGIVYTRRRY